MLHFWTARALTPLLIAPPLAHHYLAWIWYCMWWIFPQIFNLYLIHIQFGFSYTIHMQFVRKASLSLLQSVSKSMTRTSLKTSMQPLILKCQNKVQAFKWFQKPSITHYWSENPTHVLSTWPFWQSCSNFLPNFCNCAEQHKRIRQKGTDIANFFTCRPSCYFKHDR